MFLIIKKSFKPSPFGEIALYISRSSSIPSVKLLNSKKSGVPSKSESKASIGSPSLFGSGFSSFVKI